MLETSARLLQLLSLLQTHRHWSGGELADELGVTTRTVRRDVDRLRDLGYPVEAVQGTAGYRLGAGSALPPLLLDDQEAVAVAIALRTATASAVEGIEDTSLRALAKLEQVLPSRLRHRIRKLQQATARRSNPTGPRVDPEVLLRAADAIAGDESLRFDYTGFDGAESTRLVEPHQLVSWDRRWYLVAWDVGREDWRSFRVDRMLPKRTPGPRFVPRDPPGGDAVAYVSRQLATGPWAVRGVFTLHEPAEVVRPRVWPGMGDVEPVDEESCLLHVGAESAGELAWMVTALGVDFTVDGPPELVAAVEAFGDRCRRAVGGR